MKAEFLAVALAGCFALLQVSARADDRSTGSTTTALDRADLSLPLPSPFKLHLELSGIRFVEAPLALDRLGDDGRPRLRSYGTFLDLYSVRPGPRISAGLIENGSRLGLRATCPSTCVVGATGLGEGRSGNRVYKKPKPYLGLGYGDSLEGLPLSFGFDIGVLLQNQLRSGSSVPLPAAGQGNLENATDNFGYNPIVQFSLGWRF